MLLELISEAEALIEAETGRIFEIDSETTRYLDAIDNVDGMWLHFDEDCISITTVTNGDSVEVTNSEYVTEPRNVGPYYAIKLLDSAQKTWTYTGDHENAISVTGKWGFSEDPPADVQQACRDLAHIAYKQRDNLADVSRPLLSGDGNVIMPDEYPKSFRRVIAKYRKVVQ